ncbi:hypothetical protein VTK73DRAFT_5925 [Phialemonium thermophilum]|uniref:Early meiotic induction protein 1 n=1 Tax=Phialemonium thermophilum TaxID=223376 RepID=A0ABR3WLK5_9PEZI
MGWFWKESTEKHSAAVSQNGVTTGAQSPASSSLPPPSSSAGAPPSSSAPDAADREMQKFLEMIQSEVGDSRSSEGRGTQSSAKPSTSQPVSSWWSSPSTSSSSQKSAPAATITGGGQQQPITAAGRTPASRAISESLLPTDMSCRDAFDYAWHCHTPAAQWNAVYRYGSVRSCSELWDDFWFCMRVKGYKDPDARARAIRDHFRVREAARYGPGKPSSEDIWESREEKVPPGTAFTQRFDGPEESDKEWQVREIERRRAVRQQMGFKE